MAKNSPCKSGPWIARKMVTRAPNQARVRMMSGASIGPLLVAMTWLAMPKRTSLVAVSMAGAPTSITSSTYKTLGEYRSAKRRAVNPDMSRIVAVLMRTKRLPGNEMTMSGVVRVVRILSASANTHGPGGAAATEYSSSTSVAAILASARLYVRSTLAAVMRGVLAL